MGQAGEEAKDALMCGIDPGQSYNAVAIV